jgi:hypothetical protein
MMAPQEEDDQVGAEPVQVEIGVTVLVSDPDALRDYARRRYAACWFDAEWAPEDLPEAVLEALVLSNENPSPVDYGIEILESRATEASAEEQTRPHTASGRPRKGTGEA